MRPAFVFILAVTLVPACLAREAVAQRATQPAESSPSVQPNPQQIQVNAAIADAANHLYGEISVTPITARITAGQLLDRIGSEAALRHALQQAEQVGGTRWLDAQTPQVRLEIDGQVVADVLVQSARLHLRDLPASLPLDALEVKLAPWRARTFAATGTATGQAQIARLRPDPSDAAWGGVSDTDRRSAIAAARANAIARVLDSVNPIEITTGKTIANALTTSPISQAVHAWMQSRPVTAVEFRDDLEVRLSLAVTPDDFYALLADALKKAGATQPADDRGWNQLHDQIVLRMAPAVGRGVIGGGATVTNRPVSLVPATPPIWVSETLDAEAIAQSAGRLLRTARVAESAADDRLRARLDTLSLSPGLTIGEAGRQDPAIRDALDRSMRRAHVYKVDYNDPQAGSVRVRVTISLDDVWRELNLH